MRLKRNFGEIIFKLIFVIDGWGVSYEIFLWRMSLELTDDKSTLVQVMALCRLATGQYLCQCWPSSFRHMPWLDHDEFLLFHVWVVWILKSLMCWYLSGNINTNLYFSSFHDPETWQTLDIHLRIRHKHSFIDSITVTSWWARWRLKSPVSRLFTQPFIQI